jgi:hypothetical protein
MIILDKKDQNHPLLMQIKILKPSGGYKKGDLQVFCAGGSGRSRFLEEVLKEKRNGNK